MHQIQQEQDHFLHPPVAMSHPLINPSNIELPSADDIQHNDTIQRVINILIFSVIGFELIAIEPTDSWSSITTQPLSLELRAQQGAQRLHNEMILQENLASKECRIHIQQRAQYKAQKYLMDGMLMNLEARSKGLNNLSYHPFGNLQSSFNPNQYINDLSCIPSQDQQEYSNDSDEYQIQRDDDHNSSDEIFGKTDLIQLQTRDHRGKGKKCRGRGKAQSHAQPFQTNHRPIQESIQSKLKVPGQRRVKTGAANETINSSTQSSPIKQITGGSDFNFGSSMDIDMEQMMERDLTKIQSTTNDSPIVSIAPPQFGTASWHAGGDTADVFAAQLANIQHLYNGNEINIPQQGHLAAQGADGFGFQPLIGQEQEQSEDRPEQDQGQQDLYNLSYNSENKVLSKLIQETIRSEANKGSIKPRP
ncbi:MAG: hypothetical protein EZS28_031183, partial [Streblomastix strix]